MALELPVETRAAFAAWRDEAIAARDDVRPVPPEALHVTLAFLGHRREQDIERIAETTRGALAGLGRPRLAATGSRPVPPKRPRLFALDLSDEGGRAADVSSAIGGALAAAGLYRPEKRPFWPHVTFARVKGARRAAPLEAPPPPGDPFDAVEVVLYRSLLAPRGARYEPLARAAVGG